MYAKLREPQLPHAWLPSVTDLRHVPHFFWTWPIRYPI
jgi:hypothetical protein